MDAEEIRAMEIQGRGNGRGGSLDLGEFDVLRFIGKLLREGVAQLAELNATLREEVKQEAFEEVTSSKPAQCSCGDRIFGNSCPLHKGAR